MKKDKKKILLIVLCSVLAIAAIIALVLLIKPEKKEAVENTKWISLEDSSILTLNKSGEKESFDWTLGDNSRKGIFIVYTGKKAESRLDEYAQSYIEVAYENTSNGNDIPEGEKFGFEDEIEKNKKELQKDGAFLLEESDISVNGGAPENKELPYRHIYLGIIDTVNDDNNGEQKYLTLTDVRTYRVYSFSPYSEETLKEYKAIRAEMYKKLEQINDDGKDKNLGVKSYVIPKGYEKVASEKGFIEFIESNSFSKEIVINIMENTPLYGISDEFPVKEKAKQGNVEGYSVTEEYGPGLKYCFLFENNGSSYIIEANDKDDLKKFVSSIEL